MKRVVLVSMPFGSTAWPSIALGLLKAALQRDGIPCDTRYLNLVFARRIGVSAYESICNSTTDTLVGEWAFGHELFGDSIPPPEDYVSRIVAPEVCFKSSRSQLQISYEQLEAETMSWLLLLREQAEHFVGECLSLVPWEEYRIVGFTSTFQQNVASLALARRLKDQYPSLTIVLGGANCEGKMGLTLHRLFPFVDYVCSGEADLSFPLLAKRILAGEPSADIAGVFRRVAGKSVGSEVDNQPIPDMGTLPFPEYGEFVSQRRDYLQADSPPHLLIETGRGCWWGEKSHCIFCGLNGATMRFRAKPPDRAVAELAHLKRQYDVREISAVDNILDMHYFRTLLPRLAELGLNLTLFYETKANLQKEHVKLLREAGIVKIQPGIESLSTAVLQLMRKGVNALQNIQLLRWCSEYGVSPGWNLLAGFPGEEPSEYSHQAAIIPLLVHLPAPTGVTLLRLDRFSPLFVNAGQNGIRNVEVKQAYRYIYPFATDDLFELAYFFDFAYADGRDPKSYTENLSQEVRAWIELRGRPQLTSLSVGDELLICDTRPIAAQESYLLSDGHRAVYDYCDSARTYSDLRERVQQYFGDTTEMGRLDSILEELIASKLLLRLDGKYLSLAVSADYQARKLAQYVASELEPPLGAAPLLVSISKVATDAVRSIIEQEARRQFENT